MPTRFRIALLALLGVLLVLPPSLQAQPAPSTPQELRQALDQILDDEAFQNAFWGVLVVDLDADEVLYRRNEKKSFTPASNTKLYTTSAALDQLGPDYRYRTRIYVDGPIEDGVLKGNLIVRGSGDPTLGGHYDPKTGERLDSVDATALFRAWADSLREAGIHRIEGDIVGDDDVFDDLPLGYGWSWDDETYWYSAQLSGLSFNDNLVNFEVAAQAEDMPALLSWQPFDTDYIEVINKTRTIDPDSSLDEGYRRERGTNTIHVSTRVPVGRTDTEALTISNPTLFFTHTLRASLLQAGLSIAGRPVDVDDLSIKPDYESDELRQVAVHTSRPLSDIVTMINKPSQNLYADQLLKTLAAERPVDDEDLEPGSAEMGIEAAMETFVRAGIDTSRIALADGSGLSRMNLVTPEMTLSLLRYMRQHPNTSVRSAFQASLPIGGVDGTLDYRFKEGAAYDNLRAKTGTLSHVSSLSGYVTSASGTPLAFVMMSNHFTVKTRAVRSAQDRLGHVLARYQR